MVGIAAPLSIMMSTPVNTLSFFDEDVWPIWLIDATVSAWMFIMVLMPCATCDPEGSGDATGCVVCCCSCPYQS